MFICWLNSISSISVGMYPIVLIQFPKSLQLMKPSLSLSNSLKASLNSVEQQQNFHTDKPVLFNHFKICLIWPINFGKKKEILTIHFFWPQLSVLLKNNIWILVSRKEIHMKKDAIITNTLFCLWATCKHTADNTVTRVMPKPKSVIFSITIPLMDLNLMQNSKRC